jgi:hypothetical protein
MSIFQKMADAIKNWQAPAWLKFLLSELNGIMMGILKAAGQAYIQYLQALIIEAAQHSTWTPGEKFNYVYTQAKKSFVEFGVTLKDNEINTLINYLVSMLKSKGVIK